jgi:hypothetical protein
MFCPGCGHELQEGHAFCKYCGARLDDDAPAPLAEPEGPAEVAPPAPAPPPVLPPPPADATPAGPSSVPPNNNTRTLLIVAAVVLGVLILAGAAFAALTLTSDSSKTEAATTLTVETVDVTGTTAADAITTDTTAAADTTTLSMPSDGSDTTTDTTASGSPPSQDYLDKMNSLESTLVDADSRMAAIASTINATTPNLPTSVYDDLVSVGEDVMAAYDWLNAESPPAGYGQAQSLLLQAGDAMVTRIDKTKQGYLAIDGAGRTDAGIASFAAGKAAKDQFTKLFAEYQQARP